MKYVHTNIVSRDWRRLSQFYIEVFDCEIVPPMRNQSGEWLSKGTGVLNAKLEGVHLSLPGYKDGGPTLEIYSYSNVVDNLLSIPNRQGFGHIAFEVENVKSILDKVKENGGSAYGEISSHNIPGKGVIVFAYLKDPDGNIIEVQQWK